jgi:oligopeptide transport system ATP-binding protein
MNEEILVIDNLKVEFSTESGIVHAVNGISYCIKSGETVGLVGESGCGKSVSMLAVMGLLPKQQSKVDGNIFYKEQNLRKLLPNELRLIRGNKVAMIFQDPMTSLNPLLTVEEQLIEPMIEHLKVSKKIAKSRAIELLRVVGIPSPEKRLSNYPHQFSGGMRQRVMIAMALTCNPDLLIADEPTTALDVTISAQIIELVKDLRKKFGMSIIWITHDLGVVAGLVDRLLVMYAGKVIEEGSVESIYEMPLHPYTKGLLGAVPRLDSKLGQSLTTIKGKPPSLFRLPAGCPFSPRCEYTLPICQEKNPPLFEMESNHYSACWVDLQSNKKELHQLSKIMEKL